VVKCQSTAALVWLVSCCHLCFLRCDTNLFIITSFTEVITNCINICHIRSSNLWTVWHVPSTNAISLVVQVDIMMPFRGIRGITPLILTHGTVWRWVVSITPCLLLPWGRNPTAVGCECGWASRASLDVLEKRKISCLSQHSNPGPSSPKTSHCSDYTVLVSMLGLLDVSSVSFRIMNSCTLCLVPHQLLTWLLLLISPASLTSYAVAFHIISVFWVCRTAISVMHILFWRCQHI
jgi:hypothetical protein